MKTLVMSDSHFRRGFSLNDKLISELTDSDIIIHCGDFTSIEFYEFLNRTGKLIAVRGNNDFSLTDVLPLERNIDIEGFKVAVTHGHLVNIENIHYKYPESDIIIYGHLHHPAIERYGEKLILSPGSLTYNRYVNYNSFITIDFDKKNTPVIKIHKLSR